MPDSLCGKVVAANEAWAKRMKLPLESVRGLDAFEFLPTELKESRWKFARQVIKTGQSIHFEDHRDGMVLENHMYPVVNKAGQVVQIAIFSTDITDRRQALEHLKIFQNIVSSTQDGIAYVDRNYRYKIVNDTYERFSGRSRKTLIGQTVTELLGRSIPTGHQTSFRQMSAGRNHQLSAMV